MPVRKPEPHPFTNKTVKYKPRGADMTIIGTCIRVDENGAVTIQRKDGSFVLANVHRTEVVED